MLVLSGIGGYFGTKMVGGVVGKLTNQNKFIKGVASVGVTALVLLMGEKYLNKYTMSIAVGSGVAAAINLLEGLSGLLGSGKMLPGLGAYDAPARMGSRVHAEDGLSGSHDLMAVDNDNNEDDLYEGIFSTPEA